MTLGLRKSMISVAIGALLTAPVANATNGYFMPGYSTKNKGMAGAGVAWSQDAMGSAVNPAGMAFVERRLDVGLALFSPSPRKYTVTGDPSSVNGLTLDNFCATGPGNPITPASVPCQPPFSVLPGSVESENDIFLIPHFAYNHPLNSRTTVGISIYGNGGMNTEYKGGTAQALNPSTGAIGGPFPGTYGAGTAGVNLEQMFFNLNSAYKLNSNHAVGGGLIIVGQRFRAQGLEGFSGFSVDGTSLSGNRNSYSWGFGLKIGYQGEVADGVRLGASYQSKMSMGEFDEYKGLFAEGGDFDIPSTYTLGLAFDVGDSGTLVADYQRINYSGVKSLNNPVAKLSGGGCLDSLNGAILAGTFPAGPFPSASGATCLGGSDGAGFGWEDIGIFKIGYQFNAANIDWRFGYSYSDQPIPDSETLFNILAPAVNTQHISAGMTMPLGSDQEFNLSVIHALNDSVKGANPFDGGLTQIEIEMSQWDIQAGWAMKF